ncbi:hypothetical protein KIPE111705_07085 [Kibdelosporangium persicum]|uniref:Uncharacterized protein n=1 Tax=Kibdelosporangium persicum TaxID=2698649 RepID=A0ABX2FJ86_9PSEU|nr:hypothetical protein [Kibdelosporangium persicum]NRN70831.1 hypothetical protein [Kibdelosporangium persicum]
MIPFGRTTVDRAGIAKLHNMSWRKAERAKPWTLPAHPKPLTPPNTRPVLWDMAQAEAFARGAAVPALPTVSHPQDALHFTEAADIAKMNHDYWEQEVHRGRLPKPNIEVHEGVFFYSREVAEQVTAQRQVRRTGGGRPPGATEKIKRADIPRRVAELFDLAADKGDPEPSIAEVQRTLGIAYSTAHKHVHLIKAQRAAAATTPHNQTVPSQQPR